MDKLANTACKNYTEPLCLNNSYYEFYFCNNNAYIDAYFAYIQSEKCRNHTASVADHDLLLHLVDSNVLLNEMRLLNLNESKLINLIRAGYASDCEWFDNPKLVCSCFRHSRITTAHLLYECPLNHPQRKILQNEYIRIEPEYNKPHIWNDMKYILFPHLLYKNADYKTKPNQLRRYALLKALYQFCRHRWPD